MSKHQYEINATYSGGLAGAGRVSTKNLESGFSAPKEFGGKGIGTNPEELLGAAANACYLISVNACFQFQKIEGVEVQNTTRVEATSEGGLRITQIMHFPKVKLPPHSNLKERVQEALLRAEKFCLIGNAVRGNVQLSVEATFVEGQ